MFDQASQDLAQGSCGGSVIAIAARRGAGFSVSTPVLAAASASVFAFAVSAFAPAAHRSPPPFPPSLHCEIGAALVTVTVVDTQPA